MPDLAYSSYLDDVTVCTEQYCEDLKMAVYDDKFSDLVLRQDEYCTGSDLDWSVIKPL